MTTVFISHSNADDGHTERVAASLRGAGFGVWVDYENIRGGAEWLCEIEAGIARCDALLVILSRASAASEWVERECLYAAQLGKPLLVALVADTLIPLHLINLQYCDLRRSDGMAKLVESLHGLAERESKHATDRLSVSPLESNFFPYLAQLPQGEVVELVARDLHEWALEHADAVDFAGRRRPGFHARVHVGGRRVTWFSVWAYRKRPAVQIGRRVRAYSPQPGKSRSTIPLRQLENAEGLEGLKAMLLDARALLNT